MDRNQLIGITLIFLLLFVYLQFFAPNPQPKQAMKDTAAQLDDTTRREPAPSTAGATIRPQDDSLTRAQYRHQYGDFAVAATGEDRDVVLENKDLRLTVSTRGGRVKEVLLKKYKTYDKQPLMLIDPRNSNMALRLPTTSGEIDLMNLYFSTEATGVRVVNEGDSARVVFRVNLSPTQYVEQVYTLRGSGFQVGYDLRLAGLDNLVGNNPVRLDWTSRLKRFELDIEGSRITSTVNYYTAEETFDYLSEASKDPEEKRLEEPLQWISLKQKFFLSSLIARNTQISGAVLRSSVNPADSSTIKTLEASLFLPVADLKSGKGSYDFYFGPNDFQTVKDVADNFGRNVYLGWPVVRWVNRLVIVPIFHFLERFISNYGVLIIVLVLLIKTLLLPLVYKSYIAMAKMRALKPEIDEMKAQFPDDTQKQQQEQMKLYGQVGVNPLSGCIPVLLQMPILLALFSLFPNLIELRQKEFLWAGDLSTYDSIATLPFVIPFYGSHVSLFTILMTISSIAYAYYNNQLTTIEGPTKTLQYIMPVMFMFILNSLPAGLSFYYFVSNMVTIGQQLTIRRFVDDDKIRKTLEENKVKNKDKKKSKFQQRLEDALKQAEEAKRTSDTRKGPTPPAKPTQPNRTKK
jgi:YidC/Oxa1 family membrane protein insertase